MKPTRKFVEDTSRSRCQGPELFHPRARGSATRSLTEVSMKFKTETS